MADQRTVKGEKPRPIHPEVQSIPAMCVDAIDLGEVVKKYKDSDPYVAEEYAFLFYTGEVNPDTQKPFEVKVTCTVSMGPKANLRKLLETWRGKPYTQEQLDKGVDLHKLVGQWGLITIAHKTSEGGKKYANIISVTPMHPAIPKPELPPYTRDKFWGELKAKNAEEVAKFRHTDTAFAQEHEEGFEDFERLPPVKDNDLPFSPMVR